MTLIASSVTASDVKNQNQEEESENNSDDGSEDDSEDNSNANNSNPSNEPEMFVCDNGNEIPMDWVNDGMDDCGDNSDENSNNNSNDTNNTSNNDGDSGDEGDQNNTLPNEDSEDDSEDNSSDDGSGVEEGILQFIQERPVQSSVVAVSSLTMIGFAISSESIRWPVTHRFWLSMAFVFGLVKKRKDGEFQRGRVFGIIQSNPGIHLSALVRTAELGNNHTAHILEVLQQEGYIWNRKVGKQVRFFSSDISSDLETTELPSHAETLVQDSIPHQILMHLNRVELMGEKPPNGKTLAKELEISTELLSYHIRQL